MGRILFWLGLAALIYAAIVVARTKRKPKGPRRSAPVVQENERQYSSVRMVKCPVCGTHFPEDESVLGDGVAFCSEKCRKAARMKVARRHETEQ